MVSITALVALGAAMASTSGCGHAPVPVPVGILRILSHEMTVAPGVELELEATVEGLVWETSGNPAVDTTFPYANTIVYVTHPRWGECAHFQNYFWPVGPYPYHVDPSTDASVTPTGPQDTSSSALFIGKTPGMYFVLCRTFDGTQVTQTTVTVTGAQPVTPPTTRIVIVVPGFSVVVPVVVGQIYFLPVITGIDWTVVIPPGGVSVVWNGGVIVGNVTVVNGVAQVVFNQNIINIIAPTIPLGTVEPVEVSFTVVINGTLTQIVFVIWVQGTGTTPPPAGGDASAIVSVEAVAPPEEVN